MPVGEHAVTGVTWNHFLFGRPIRARASHTHPLPKITLLRRFSRDGVCAHRPSRFRPGALQGFQAEWDRRDIPVPLKVLDSPYREITRPVVDYVKSVRRGSPRDVVMVYIPEYVLGRWWEQLLHNQSALRLKGRLLFTPGVMVASVPWQLRSSEGVEERLDRPRAGSIRRGS